MKATVFVSKWRIEGARAQQNGQRKSMKWEDLTDEMGEKWMMEWEITGTGIEKSNR